MELNNEQRLAIEHEAGPLLVVAGAGTGKTTVIVERVKRLLQKQLAKPNEILALTFTERAAQEMQERVDVALPMGFTQTWISTFHSFGEQILRNEAIHIGLSPSFQILSSAESALFLTDHLFQLPLSYYRPLGNPTKFINGLLQHFSRLKDEDIDPSQYLQFVQSAQSNPSTEPLEKERFLELANCYKTYEDIKNKEGILDISDLIIKTLRLFRQRPNILAKYQKQFKYLLIDEFQDTNYAQNELAILLAGKEQNITVVFDDDQAIYRWRGAAVYNVLDFKKHFPKTKIITLTQNYRSNQKILDVAYNFIQNNNPDRLEATEKISKRLIAQKTTTTSPTAFTPRSLGAGGPISLIFTDRVEDEAEKVSQIINQLTTLTPPNHPSYNFKDIAILVRANNHAEPFIKALKRLGLPYQFLGPARLFSQEEIKDLIGFLQVLDNFEDNVATYRVLNMPILDIFPRDIAAIVNYSKKNNLSLFETLEKAAHYQEAAKNPSPSNLPNIPNPPNSSIPRSSSEGGPQNLTPETYKKAAKLVELIHRYLALVPKETTGQILYYFVKDSGLLEYYQDPQNQKQQQEVENISKFFDKVKAYETKNPASRLPDFVKYLDFLILANESPLASEIDWSQENAVNLITVHSAKGLEFPVVFLPNLVEQRFPTRQRTEQIPIPDEIIKETLPQGDPHLEEERRLFYVAITRSKDLLYLSGAKFYGDNKRPKKPSEFINEALGEDWSKYLLQEKSASQKPTLFDWVDNREVLTGLHPASEQGATLIKPKITFISYSQINTFGICPLHYKLRYIVGLPTLQFAAASFGDSVHKALKEFYQKALAHEKLSADDLLKILENNWKSVGYENKAHEKEQKDYAKKALTHFFETQFDPNALPKYLEQPFKIRITPQLVLGGVIDRIDELPMGQIEIIDYKTGKIPTQKEIDEDLQISIYAWAASLPEIFGIPLEKQVLSFYYFEAGQKLQAKRTTEDIEKAKAKILETVEKIENSDFLCSGNIICQKCEYKLFCNG